MREEINQFLIKESKSGLSEGTLKKYEIDLKLFLKFIDHRENIKSIGTLDDDRLQIIINKYINFLKRERYKPSTINNKIVTINKFMRYLSVKLRE